ncbi:hypothetical protein F5883DRAFT_17635 [Diaporthe sp. PMI_573]|nr:hypothetical protein F5883DRAFT_17635 [Diaporthaceae sp. PMI_573]
MGLPFPTFLVFSCVSLFLPHPLHDEQDILVKRDMAKFCISPWLLTTLRFYELKRRKFEQSNPTIAAFLISS